MKGRGTGGAVRYKPISTAADRKMRTRKQTRGKVMQCTVKIDVCNIPLDFYFISFDNFNVLLLLAFTM